MLLKLEWNVDMAHLVLEGSQVADPGVGVAIILPLLAKVSGQVAIDDRLRQYHSLNREGGREGGR